MDSTTTETLFTEVGLVQNELNKFGAENTAIDVNEIYEYLEINSYRNNRVEYVVSLFLFNLGFKSNLKDVGNGDSDSSGSNDNAILPFDLDVFDDDYYQELKAKEELLECGCCFSDVRAEDVATCNEAHIFCKQCIKKGAEVQIGNGKHTFPCLSTSTCESEFSLKTLENILEPTVFSNMLQRKQLEEVQAAKIDDLETCPFCDFSYIPAREDKVFLCLNPKCKKESCRKCKELNHLPLRCEEVEKDEEVKMRTYIEDKMTEALVRTCWRCHKKFVKTDGCNKMTCTCGALMCYVCRQPVTGYNHFINVVDRRAVVLKRCPLYSNNAIIHDEAVKKEAIKAKKEIKAQHPNIQLKHDPTEIYQEKRGLKRTAQDFINNVTGGKRRRQS